MDALEWTMQGTSIKHVGWREDVEIPTRPGGSPPQQACNRTPDKQIRKTSLSTTNLPHLTARPMRAPACTIPVWVWPAQSQFRAYDSSLAREIPVWPELYPVWPGLARAGPVWPARSQLNHFGANLKNDGIWQNLMANSDGKSQNLMGNCQI